MLFHSRFQPDPDRFNEWMACLWQGPAPADIKMRMWIRLQGEPMTMILLWEGGAEAEAFIERTFGRFGKLETSAGVEANEGMVAAFARDLPAFEQMMHKRGADPAEVARQVDLRRRGMEAPDQPSAIAAIADWPA